MNKRIALEGSCCSQHFSMSPELRRAVRNHFGRSHQRSQRCASEPILAGWPWLVLSSGLVAQPEPNQWHATYGRRSLVLCTQVCTLGYRDTLLRHSAPRKAGTGEGGLPMCGREELLRHRPFRADTHLQPFATGGGPHLPEAAHNRYRLLEHVCHRRLQARSLWRMQDGIAVRLRMQGGGEYPASECQSNRH